MANLVSCYLPAAATTATCAAPTARRGRTGATGRGCRRGCRRNWRTERYRRGPGLGRHFHRLGRRRHRGDDEVAVGDDRARAFGTFQVVPAHVVVEIQVREVGGEVFRDLVRVAVHLDRVAHHVQHAAALQAGAEAVVLEPHRNRDADGLAGCEALEVDVLRRVADRVELHVADQRARRVAVGLDLVETGLPAGALQFAQHGAGLQRDQAGGLVGAVNHRRHHACAPGRPRRPLTGSRACLGL